MIRLGTSVAAAVVGAGLLWTAPALAQDLPVTHLKAIGLQSHLNRYKTGEKPF